MALPSFMKHIHLLEQSGWIRTRKQGRVRTCTIDKARSAAVDDWLAGPARPGRSAPTASSSSSPNQPETTAMNPDLDLTISRIIKAPRSALWDAWTDPVKFAQWWIPAPTLCKVVAMDAAPGRRVHDPDERGRRRFRAASRRLLPGGGRNGADRLHQLPARWMAPGRTRLHERGHHASRTIPTAPNITPMQCTRTGLIGTRTRRWGSMTGGALSRRSLHGWWNKAGSDEICSRCRL